MCALSTLQFSLECRNLRVKLASYLQTKSACIGTGDCSILAARCVAAHEDRSTPDPIIGNSITADLGYGSNTPGIRAIGAAIQFRRSVAAMAHGLSQIPCASRHRGPTTPAWVDGPLWAAHARSVRSDPRSGGSTHMRLLALQQSLQRASEPTSMFSRATHVPSELVRGLAPGYGAVGK